MQPLLQRKSNEYYIFCVCVWSLMYPACNARVTNCHPWSVRLCNIFPHYLTNGRIFGKKKKLLNTICASSFSDRSTHKKIPASIVAGWASGRSGRHGKSHPIVIRPPDRSARSQSLQRLSYPGRLFFYSSPTSCPSLTA